MLTDRELHHAFRYCVALTGNRDDAYDLLQSGMVKWLERPSAKIGKPAAYLRRILRNLFLDQNRIQRPTQVLDETDGEVIAYDGHNLEAITIRAELTQAIMKTLMPADRELLFLWAVEGFTIEEISQMVSRPRGTLLSRLHRIRKRIQVAFPQPEKEVSL